MALSNCVKCGHQFFEAQPISIGNSPYQMMAIRCSGCGGVVSITEAQSAADLVRRLAKALDATLPPA
jgi:hypothetical protein